MKCTRVQKKRLKKAQGNHTNCNTVRKRSIWGVKFVNLKTHFMAQEKIMIMSAEPDRNYLNAKTTTQH